MKDDILIQKTALFEVIYDDCKLKFIHRMFNISDLGSACSQQTCDHVILFFKSQREINGP